MATIYFSLSGKKTGTKKQILVRFAHTSFNQRAKSGLFVEETYWDNMLQTVSIPKPRLFTDEIVETIKRLREIEAQLRELRIRIEDAYTNSPTAPIYDKDWLKTVVAGDDPSVPKVERLDFFEAWDAYIRLSQVSDKRKEMFKVVKNMLYRFEQVYQMRDKSFSLSLANFPPVLLSEFEKFLWEEDKYVDKYPHIYKGCRDVKRGQNTISCRLKVVRAFFNWCINNNLAETTPFAKFKIKTEVYGTPVYISKEERDILWHHEMSSEALNRIRDIFIFQCCIGCRVGDLMKFTYDNVIDGAIEYIAGKTADNRPETVRVPLNSIARAIIKKYQSNKRKTLLPFISQQNYNDGIKECFKQAGLVRTITVYDARTGTDKRMPLCDYAASHMARRTFVGNLYAQVQDPNLIASLSGHREGSKAFARYRNIDEELKRKTVELLE